MGMETFLPPIEKPTSIMMKLVYALSRRQFGKVATPIKVFAARMPLAFGSLLGKIGALDKKLSLDAETQLLVRQQVARLNVCLFCMDLGRYYVIQKSLHQAKFDALDDYRTSAVFTAAQRAALDYVTELTKEKVVSRDTFARLAEHYSERQICEIVWLVASEHMWNLTNIGLNIHSDMFCDLSMRQRIEQRAQIGAR